MKDVEEVTPVGREVGTQRLVERYEITASEGLGHAVHRCSQLGRSVAREVGDLLQPVDGRLRST